MVEEKMAAGATPAPHEAASELRQGLKALQHRLNLFIEYAPAAFAMFDRDLRYIFASRRWKENIGLADQDLVGQRHYDIFPDLPAEWIDAHARCLAGESLGASEDTFEHNGKTEWLRWQIEPWRDDSGDVGGIIMFGEFITARKELEAELAMHQKLLEQRVAERTRELAVATADAHLANEQKSAFLSATSHDLRQPLQAASTYLSVIESRAEPEISAVAKKALGALQVASDILSALLNLSQLNAGAVAVQPERFRVHALQERLILQFQSDAASKNIELVCRPSDLILRTDPRLLERIVANFVANSIRFTSSGFVELGCVRHEEGARIYVRDTGVGIAAKDVDRIFDDFTQLDNAARDRVHGYGLGLSIAKRIAERLDCPIGVDSTPGEGSTFWIDVPVTDRAPDEVELSSPTLTRASSAKILLVDDDEMVGDAAELLLLNEGYKTTRAKCCESALKAVHAGFLPDFIISDYRLPDGNGADLIVQLRAELATEIPGLLLTGDTVLGAAHRRGLETLHKPVSARALKEALGKLQLKAPR